MDTFGFIKAKFNLNVLAVVTTAVGRVQPKPSEVKCVAVVRRNCFQSLMKATLPSVRSRKKIQTAS